MKKRMIIMIAVMMLGCFMAQSADAGDKWYTCDVQYAGLQYGIMYIRLTERDGVFANKWCLVSGSTAEQNQILAVALTAVSAGRQVRVRLDASETYPLLDAIYVR